MSRFDGEYDPDFDNQWAFWEQATKRALHSKRGHQALIELREALLALPDKRLIYGRLCRYDRATGTGEVCFVGAYLWHKQVKDGVDPADAFAAIPTAESPYAEEDGEQWQLTMQEGEHAGLRKTLVNYISCLNDEDWGTLSPEARYKAALEWIEKTLAADGVSV